MRVMHQQAASGRWFRFSLMEQLSNVGSEIERTIRWKEREELEDSRAAFERALELLDLTVADPKNKNRLKEILRAREALVDYFMYNNEYMTTDKFWRQYFLDFGFAAAIQRGR